MTVQVGASFEPRLTLASSGPQQGTTWPIDEPAVVLGRAPDADLRVEEPTVSRRHVRFERRGDHVVVSDLGSSSGTTVNGRPVQAPVELHDGDEVGVAVVTLRFSAAGTPTATSPRVEPHQSSYVVDRQQAGHLSNVGRDQYLQTVHAQRDGFLREVAATRTRARILVWFGVLLFVAGGGIGVTVLSRAFSIEPADSFEEFERQGEDIFGPDVGGVPLFIVGMGMTGVGGTLVLIGIVLHVVATSRRRRVQRDVVPMLPGAFNVNHLS